MFQLLEYKRHEAGEGLLKATQSKKAIVTVSHI